MQSAAASCRSLDSRVQMAGRQGLSLKNNSTYSSFCTTSTQSMNPSGAGGSPSGGSGSGSGTGSAQTQSNAAQNALQAAEEAEKAAAAKADFKSGLNPTNAKDMNVADLANNPMGNGYTGNGAPNPNLEKIPGGGKAGANIANNSGGQIPGQGGGGDGAKLGGGGRGGSPGSPGYSTDVLGGLKGGGGGGGTGGGSTATNGDGDSFKGYGGGRMPAAEKGLDLRQYLPGGQKDPGIRYGGLKYENIPGVHGPNVNIWFRINTRFIEKCRLGELFSCELK